MHAILALEDGHVFEGEAFGAVGTTVGEVVFNTAMTGYQEMISDPSYMGQIIAMTYPLIGNYGVNPLDQEGTQPRLRGLVIEELSPVASNWRSRMSLNDYLKHWNVPGIQGIDTRALTRRLREKGILKGCLTTDPSVTVEDALARAREWEGLTGVDLARTVSTRKVFEWDPQDVLSRKWTVVKGSGEEVERDNNGEVFEKLPPTRYHIVALDLGIKLNILRRLRQEGFKVTVVPATTTAEAILALNPEGVFISNGPGDPAALPYVHQTVKDLIGKTPIFGICLGHQILSYAVGGKTYKLKFGHHGGNQPVKDVRSGKVLITSQNHNFAVDPDSLPLEMEVSHINLNDQTVEGMCHKNFPVFSVQFHPEAAPGPNDAGPFFEEFANLIEATRKG